MGGCSVPECKNRSGKGIKIRQCPINQERRKKWISYLLENGFNWEVPKNFFVCDVHFQSFYSSDGYKPEKEDPKVPKGTWYKTNLNVSLEFNFCRSNFIKNLF